MKHHAVLFTSLAILFLSVFQTPVSSQVRPPNIVVIVADDMGYADIGVQGSKDIPTPNIDSLAANGVRFTDAYVTGPYCSPTRAGLLTGKYPQRFGHEFNIGMQPTHSDAGLPLSEVTIADRLRSGGYRTALLGKWHLGAAPKYHPMERGFDEFFGFLAGAHSYLAPATNSPNPVLDGHTRVAKIDYLTDELGDRAARFIHTWSKKPFFLYLAFNAVHVPSQATEKYLARFKNITNDQRRVYAAMLSAMDDGVGKTLEALRSENLEGDTLIFFFSDNGGPTIFGGINGSSNAPLKGSKRTTWEGGIRVPFIVQYKGHLPAGRVYSQPVIQLDVMPTALNVAGVKVTAADHLDGVNLIPFISGKAKGHPHDALYWRLGTLLAIRKGNWKMVRMTESGFHEDPKPLAELSGLQLFDLSKDIGETTDLSSKEPKVLKKLADAWSAWASGLAKPAWPAPRPVGQQAEN